MMCNLDARIKIEILRYKEGLSQLINIYLQQNTNYTDAVVGKDL